MKKYLKVIIAFTFIYTNSFAGTFSSYTVERGDSFMTISYKAYSTHQMYNVLQNANPDITSELMAVGSTISIPSIESFSKESKRRLRKFTSNTTALSKKTVKQTKYEKEIKEYKKVMSAFDENLNLATELPVKIIEVEPDNKVMKIDRVIASNNVVKREESLRLSNLKLEKRYIQLQVKNKNLLYKYNKAKKIAKSRRAPAKIKDVKDKYEKLYLASVQKSQSLKLELLSLKEKSGKLNTLKKDHEILKKRLRRSEKNRDNDYVKKLNSYSAIASSQSQILKEKARILSQRLWIAKNNHPEQCKIDISPGAEDQKEVFLQFVEYLNETFGEGNIFVEPNENKLIVMLSGKVVYGVQDPKIRASFKPKLAKIGNYLENLAIKNIEILGHTNYSSVYDNNRTIHSGNFFILNQAIALENHFVSEVGMSPKLFTTATFGNSRKVNKKQNKRFELSIELKSGQRVNRDIAAIQSDNALKNMASDLLNQIHEPKYSYVNIKDDNFEIHLARSYFLSGDPIELSNNGKRRLATIVDVLSQTDSAHYQISWASGALEDNSQKTKTKALKELDLIYKYIVEDLSVKKSKISVGFKNKHHRLKEAYSNYQDKMNKRIIIKVVAESIKTRPLGN